jgi:hypothetical protein
MKKISNDDTFENYVGKFIDMNINGTIRKFYVSNIDSGSITTNAGILYPDSFSILRESPNQECNICDDVCYQNIPVIKIAFQNVVDNVSEGTPFINSYSSEIHEVILNGTSLGTVNTTFQKGNHNEIWFVPYNPSQVIVSTTYASSSNSSIFNTYAYGNIDSLVLSSFDISLLNKNYYNEISLRPISAWNPVKCNDYDGCIFQPALSSAFFLNPEITLDIHKILPLTTNTSSISCQSYTMYNFSWFEGNGSIMGLHGGNDPTSLRFFNGGSSTSVVVYSRYTNTYLSAGSVFQPYSASFYYFDPCQLDSPAYYPLDPNYYYTYETDVNGEPTNVFDTRFAYGWASGNYSFYNASPASNPNLPLLRKYQFFGSANINDKIFIFVGGNTKNTNEYSLNVINDLEYKTRSPLLGYTDHYDNWGFIGYGAGGATLYNSKYANELFTGTFYALEDRTWESGTVRFRELSVYIDSSITTITQNVSVGPLI